MSRLLSRTTNLLAVALVVTVQAVVSPASCCILKSIVTGGETCSGVVQSAGARSCCHRVAVAKPDAPAHHGRVPVQPTDCPVCTSEAKLALGDRVEAPSPLYDDFLSRDHVADVTLASLLDASVPPATAFDTGEPVQRTALASCAWLCVWRI